MKRTPTKPPPRHISKSRYCSGLQCLRKLWWEVHEPEAPELQPDARLRLVFDSGHRVGELARERFPGGVLVEHEPWQVAERVASTEAALRGGAPAIFEASFAAGGAFAAVDVLERRARGFAIVEVKSTLSVKEQFLADVALQVHAARAAGLDVRRAEVMHLDRECAFPRLERLFVREDVTREVEPLLPAIPAQLRRMRAALEGNLPDVAPGERCSDPYACPFAARCQPELPEHHVSTLYCVRDGAIARWLAAGVETLHDVPADAPLSGPQARQVRAVKGGRLVVEDGLAGALSAVELPAAFLDFETVNPAVPVWRGCHPYEAVPVQMSCHVLGPRGGTAHHAHLADGEGDPRPALAEAVVRACDGARTVVAWAARFEAGCLEHLARAVPKLAEPLRSIRRRLVDLLPVVRDHVYHPAFGGGFGLKAVAPALVRGLGYEGLEVADGDTASALLAGLLLAPEAIEPRERARLRRDLLAYCARDTEALVRIHERLQGLARA